MTEEETGTLSLWSRGEGQEGEDGKGLLVLTCVKNTGIKEGMRMQEWEGSSDVRDEGYI